MWLLIEVFIDISDYQGIEPRKFRSFRWCSIIHRKFKLYYSTGSIIFFSSLFPIRILCLYIAFVRPHKIKNWFFYIFFFFSSMTINRSVLTTLIVSRTTMATDTIARALYNDITILLCSDSIRFNPFIRYTTSLFKLLIK